MTRLQYLTKQKKKGRYLFGVFPAHYPKEILWAMNILPVEIWDPPLEITTANAHLQPTICPVVKLGLELVLRGKTDILDAFLFPHTCDSIQNIASVISNYLGIEKPCYFFYNPKAPYPDSAHNYYGIQLKNFVKSLENRFGHLNPNRLAACLRQREQISTLLKELYDFRSKRRLKMSNKKFYETIRKGEYLFPDDFIPELETCLKQNKRESRKDSIPVILSGILSNPKEILSHLDRLGVLVVHDDLLNAGRRLLLPENKEEDPFKQIAQSYFQTPPCSTKGSSVKQRTEHLLHLVRLTGAKGIIANGVKFCEPEWFYIPNIKASLKEKGVPMLVLDTELNQGLSGQMKTRIEAFIEMIHH
jgi:benzoyl-CoA reductase/2-hydroxyglutaryl-CoA dehydratase subunit BcrC/BadD/HgdB